MRKVILVLLLGVVIFLLCGRFVSWQSKRDVVETMPIGYQSFSIEQPVHPIKWDVGTPPISPKNEIIALDLHVPKAQKKIDFSICGTGGIERPDSLAQKMGKDKTTLFPIDCGMIKTSIPFSF